MLQRLLPNRLPAQTRLPNALKNHDWGESGDLTTGPDMVPAGLAGIHPAGGMALRVREAINGTTAGDTRVTEAASAADTAAAAFGEAIREGIMATAVPAQTLPRI